MRSEAQRPTMLRQCDVTFGSRRSPAPSLRSRARRSGRPEPSRSCQRRGIGQGSPSPSSLAPRQAAAGCPFGAPIPVLSQHPVSNRFRGAPPRPHPISIDVTTCMLYRHREDVKGQGGRLCPSPTRGEAAGEGDMARSVPVWSGPCRWHGWARDACLGARSCATGGHGAMLVTRRGSRAGRAARGRHDLSLQADQGARSSLVAALRRSVREMTCRRVMAEVAFGRVFGSFTRRWPACAVPAERARFDAVRAVLKRAGRDAVGIMPARHRGARRPAAGAGARCVRARGQGREGPETGGLHRRRVGK